MADEPVADPHTRRAARTAAFVAVPVALIAGSAAYAILRPDRPAGAPATVAAAATGPVEVPAPALTGRPALVCRALLARLPDHLGALARRPVTAGAEQNAAYGEPAVTLACGGPAPVAPAGAQYLKVDGVCWYTEPGPGTVLWSVQGREVTLLVTVPERYTGQDLVDLARPITDTVPEVARPCD